MFIVNHPGPWQHYVNRPDNKGLNIMEIKSKYLKEQLLFEQYMSFQRQQQLLMSQNASGGSSSAGSGGVGSSGVGSDGPLSGATVTARGTSVTTNALGEFTFPFELGPTEEITITGGTDSITGLTFEGELKGYITPTVKVVSPLTTLAFYNEEAESFDAALDSVITTATNLGFTGISKDILTEDYVKKSVEENDDRAVALQAFTTYVDSLAEAAAPTLTGVATSIYGTPSTTKDVKIAMYKYFGGSGIISVKTFTQTQLTGRLDETKDGIITNVTTAIESVLKTELTNVVKDNLADANYRTTRIQGINRNIKLDIKNQVKSAVDSNSADLVKTRDSDITTILTTTQADLRQIEAGIENKIERRDDDSKISRLVEVTELFKNSERNGITFISREGESGPYTIQNLYALTTDLQVGTKLYVNTGEKVYSMDDDIVELRSKAWVLTNTSNVYPDGATAKLRSIDGETIYSIDSTGVIISKE